MGRLEKLYVKQVLKMLTAEAEKIIREAQRTKDTNNISFNQRDAYGAAIYYKGKLERTVLSVSTEDSTKMAYSFMGSIRMDNLSWHDKTKKGEDLDGRHRGWKKMGIPEAFGYEWAKMFVDEYKPKSDGFELVVFNAAFYSSPQEYGSSPNAKQTYRILSQVIGSMKDLQDNFKDSKLSVFGMKAW